MAKQIRNAVNWQLRRDIPFTILAWFAVIAIIFLLLSHIGNTIFLFTIAAIVAYALVPMVNFFTRFMPRYLAIIIVYILVFFGLGYIFYLTVEIAIGQFTLLIQAIQDFLIPKNAQTTSPMMQYLNRVGFSSQQINSVLEQLATQLETIGSGLLPILSSIVNSFLDFFIISVLSIYLIIDGSRLVNWIKNNMPHSQRKRVIFSLNTLQRIVGGYIRGQFILSLIIGVLVGVGMFLFQLPYAVLLGLLAFILSFIPFVGTFITGAACVLVGLTKGWLIALFVLIYFIIIHVIEGNVLSPKIIGHALGLHPILSLFAVISGTELFGLRGALFSAPIAGALQSLVVAVWAEWKENNPKEFQRIEKKQKKVIRKHLKAL